ncbi:MAG: family 43 glycosylhydrolase [Acidobacteriota bacterium]|jgi:arabinan endo-1,5-alpha-L-arabinosidase
MAQPIDIRVHDPVMIRQDDTYYVFCTGRGISVFSSTDMKHWTAEAPFLFRKNDYWYLFASWDRCCAGKDSTYKIVVGRSRDITGPYLDRTDQDMVHGGGTLVVKGNDSWPGVGHSATVTFDGVDYLVFHGYDTADNGRPKLWIRRIHWDEEGWPTVSLTE